MQEEVVRDPQHQHLMDLVEATVGRVVFYFFGPFSYYAQ
jgi:hypothetical protein